jgi:hypothetical protein
MTGGTGGTSSSWRGRGRRRATTALLVELNRHDFPISLDESRWVSANVGLTAGSGIVGVAQRTSGRSEVFSSPVTTEISVEGNLVALEVIFKVTGALEVGQRGAKGTGIGVAVGDRIGDARAREEPDHDVRGSPFHGIHTTTAGIEGIAKGRFGAFELAASRAIVF